MEKKLVGDNCDVIIIVAKRMEIQQRRDHRFNRKNQAEIELAEQSIKESEEELRLSSTVSSVVLLLLSSTPLAQLSFISIVVTMLMSLWL